MSVPTEKVVHVEPTDEGPKVKAKRQLTDAQLAALKLGREKLAEKRKQSASVSPEETTIPETQSNPSHEQPKSDTENLIEEKLTEDDGTEGGYHPLCLVM
jgi:hypothetical protein